MTESAKDNLLTSLLFQNMAAKYLEYTKHEVNGDGKYFLDTLTKRLKANINDCYLRITTDKGRDAYFKEFKKEDALQYANIFTSMIEMDGQQRDLVERLVENIKKGEVIEYIPETNLTARQEDEGNEGWPDEENN